MAGSVNTIPATPADAAGGTGAVETFSARLIRREAERRAALELATSTPAGLKSALARISAEVTAEAAEIKANNG